ICRQGLIDPCGAEPQGLGNLRLAWPMTGWLAAVTGSQSQQAATDVPIGFPPGAMQAEDALAQIFEGGYADKLLRRFLFVALFLEHTDEADNFLPGLVPHATHHVNVKNRDA